MLTEAEQKKYYKRGARAALNGRTVYQALARILSLDARDLCTAGYYEMQRLRWLQEVLQEGE